MPSEMLVTKNIYIPDYKISLASFRDSGILIYSWSDPLLGFCALVLPSKIGYWDTSDCHPPLLEAQANQAASSLKPLRIEHCSPT